MKKILNPYLNKEGYNCVCCAPNNPVGLHLEFWEEGEDVLTIWNPGENYQGWINTLHGGIISMLMDEVAGWVINRKLQTTGVTMQLNVKYKKPVMTTDSQITVRGHIASQRRNIVTIRVSVQNVSGTFGTAPKIRVRGATSIYGSSKPLWVCCNSLSVKDSVFPALFW